MKQEPQNNVRQPEGKMPEYSSGLHPSGMEYDFTDTRDLSYHYRDDFPCTVDTMNTHTLA